MAIDLKKFVLRFIDEANGHLHTVKEGAFLLSSGESSDAQIGEMFRAAHTLKGGARMLKLQSIADVTHQLEEILSELRDKKLAPDQQLGTLILQACDYISDQLAQLSATDGNNQLPPADEALCERLARASRGEMDSSAEQSTPPPLEKPFSALNLEAVDNGLKQASSVRVRLEKLDDLINILGEVVASHDRLEQQVQSLANLGPRLAQMDAAQLRQQIVQFSRQFKEDFQVQHLQMFELYDVATTIRMLPVSMLFEPVSTQVRELATALNKQVDCRILGGEVEIDRQLIDRLSEPLTHLLRNAIDHGIGEAAERLAAGKSARGTITLTTQQDGRGILLRVEDDGRGLDYPGIRAKAVARGLVEAAVVDQLSEQECNELIFHPGFSTSKIVTELSGRGVGLDIVRKTIVADLQGTLQVHSRAGVGTTFIIRLPISLAMMRILQFEQQNHLFGLAAQYVVEVVKYSRDEIRDIAGRPAIILHNEFIPVISAAELLRIQDRPASQTAPAPMATSLLLIIIQNQFGKMAMLVDNLLDERNMMIKPLPKHMRSQALVSGMVLSPDNQLVSILQVPVLMEMAQKRGQSRATATKPQVRANAWHVLIVDDSMNTREIEKNVLEAHGYQVTLAEDGLAGLQKARLTQFDAVLTDVEMPVMDGFSLTRALRAEENYQHIPIIIVTSRAKEEDRRRGIQVGADAYIAKGDFEQDSLIETLKMLLC
ncbi:MULTISPECIES: hybrid sensor histidine kinase/response regulator [Buttiauxella]|jgi:two-component system chemotaxis sensor kinase CheA/two-component system sensor histidine kinase and response regulator WspE|uniref:hybrid sensor histidine kinase/response regulator n=1 Tax=Buttiauxella TaxID=82976 RepID=UPI000EF7E55E|nr:MULTISPECIES: response regulator [Buttiauxella]AYN29042.1 hybrid sensor histidine kinase/response regulator [Buttiauxella sp. 3AFRM03]MCE0827386.1 response regulator [Buttiauxella ferragutiae]TDN52917.1 two-component system chemotaxis sensor kinase CheA/two-component system sensor histidine kinase and response regulator WspE [Buttiauxella sp. JUb87]UNK62153.1 response regulator [Buttiauxella ferragutiae]